jgi:hypothetical protein
VLQQGRGSVLQRPLAARRPLESRVTGRRRVETRVTLGRRAQVRVTGGRRAEARVTGGRTAGADQGHPWPAGRFGPGLLVDGGQMTGSHPDGGLRSGSRFDPLPFRTHISTTTPPTVLIFWRPHIQTPRISPPERQRILKKLMDLRCVGGGLAMSSA